MEKSLSKFNIPQKGENILLKVHKIQGAHFQCVNNHYAQFEKRNEYCLSYRLHKLGTPYGFRMEKMSKFNTCQKSDFVVSN